MRFRSVKCSSKLCGSLGLAAWSAGLFALGGFAFAVSARAAMTVGPFNAGGLSSTDGSLWFAGSNTGAPSGYILDLGGPSTLLGSGTFKALDLTKSALNESGSLASTIEFYITSAAAAPPTGSGSYLIVTTSNVQGGTAFPVAIGGVNGSSCASGVPGCVTSANNGGPFSDPAAPANTGYYYFAAPFTPSSSGGAIRVSLYPKDICTSYSVLNSGVAAQGCVTDTTQGGHLTAAVTTTPAGNYTVAPLFLNFEVINLPNTSGIVLPNPLPAAVESATVNLRFEDNNRTKAANGTVKCPTDPVNYFPGDGQILVDTDFFGPTNQLAPSGYAPIVGAILVAAPNSNLSDATGSGLTFSTDQPTGYPGDYLGGGKVIGGAGLGKGVAVPGFGNLTGTSDPAHSYDVGFLVRDAAGMVYTPVANGNVTTNGCILVGVQTSTIQGFLSKSSCFIATAAFRSIDATPVAMLREFRDRVLLPTSLGSGFVHWYYRWSPPAAEWLMLHSYLRYPVLQALAPLEAVAWLALHPWIFGLVAAILLVSILALALGARRPRGVRA